MLLSMKIVTMRKDRAKSTPTTVYPNTPPLLISLLKVLETVINNRNIIKNAKSPKTIIHKIAQIAITTIVIIGSIDLNQFLICF